MLKSDLGVMAGLSRTNFYFTYRPGCSYDVKWHIQQNVALGVYESVRSLDPRDFYFGENFDWMYHGRRRERANL